MKTTAIAFAVAGSLGLGSLSHAQGYNWGDRDGRSHDRAASAQPYEHRWDSRQAGQYAPRQYDRRYQPQYAQPAGDSRYSHRSEWTARAPQYHRGDHLPYQFRQRHHYVSDWRAHRLYAPPYGYQWVQADDGGDFLLVALATGLIANLLVNP